MKMLALLVIMASTILVTSEFQTACDEISNRVCKQYCVGGGCDLKCVKSEDYDSCEQYCTGGNCNLNCRASNNCFFGCTEGNCQSVICHARNTCEQVCTGGGCGMECYGKNCEQICTSGNCQLQCPSDADKCEQWCTINRDKCSITRV